MSQATVVIYTRGWCPYCERARRLLELKGIAFTEIDLGARPQAREEMIQRSGGRCTVPQIFIADAHVGGCDDLLALEAAGRLDQLLKGPAAQEFNSHDHKQ